MQKTKWNHKKWFGRLVIAVTIFVLSVVGLSTFYYKTLILNPMMVWHGASMSVKNAFASITGNEQSSAMDAEFLAKLKQDIQDKKLALEQANTTNIALVPKQINASILADNQSRAEQLAADQDRLSKANQQILNSKATLSSLNQDFSSITAFQEQELARIEQMQAVALQSEDVPTEQDAKALISKSITSNTQQPGVIPQRVLDNVQQTTDIAPEEINELMNQ